MAACCFFFLLCIGFFVSSHGASFHLFRRTEPNGVQLTNNILPSNFDRNKPTFILLHGMGGHHQDVCVDNVQRALLQRGDVNVIIPNYSRQAYFYTATYQSIAREIASFLIRNRVNPSTTTAMGQSLGAQVAGVLYSSGFKPEAIIGMDPAGPQFNAMPTFSKLSPISANSVQAVHTNVGGLGSSTMDGNLDVYINRGTSFPCCSNSVCRHIGACDWIADTIRKGPTVAASCSSQSEALAGTCRGPTIATGFDVLARTGPGRSVAHVSLTQCVPRIQRRNLSSVSEEEDNLL